LTLTEIAAAAQVADGAGYLGTAVVFCSFSDEDWARRSGDGQLDFERLFAAAADGAGCAELNETAIVAP
jgi:hypothetical protein